MRAALGLGLAALGRPGYLNLGHAADFAGGRDVPAMRARTHELLDAAWEGGVRHVDVARSYGRGEEFLGDWFRSRPGRREQITVGSKWGYMYVANWRVDVPRHEVKDHSLATFRRQWPETLDALGSAPDLYLVHSVTPDSPALGDPALLNAMNEVASTGVRVGLSTSGPRQADVIEQALTLGAAGPFSALQCTWNLLEPSSGPAFAAASDAGWHVALKETVANGRLTERGVVPEEVVDLATRRGVGVDAVAVAAALRRQCSVVLVGPSTIDQLRSNLDGESLPLTDDELSGLTNVAEPPSAYWANRGVMPWT